MSGEQVFASGSAAADRAGPRGIGADVGASLLFGHRHADEGALFLAAGMKRRVVDVRGDPRQPFVGELRLLPQRRHGGEGHRERAADAGLLLVEEEFEGCADDVRTGFRRTPRQRVRFVLDAERHQLVPGGMELDFVDPPAEAVVRAEDGREAVGLKAEPDDAGRADESPKRFNRSRPHSPPSRKTASLSAASVSNGL